MGFPLRQMAARALLAGLVVGLAGSMIGCDVNFDDPPPQVQRWVNAPITWPVKDIDDGETAYPGDRIRLRGVHWEPLARVREDALRSGLSWFQLVRANDMSPHPFRITVDRLESGSITINPDGGLDPDTTYVMGFPGCAFQPHIICPPPIVFSTASAPRVLGVWRVEDTLVVVFSEEMDPDSLYLGHGSADLVFEEEGKTRSVVSDLNLADFAWDTDGRLFLVAPLSELPFRLVLGPGVRSAKGVPLDADGDGITSEGGSFVHLVYPTTLPVCHTRADYPAPCITAEEAVTEWTGYDAPFNVESDVDE